MNSTVNNSVSCQYRKKRKKISLEKRYMIIGIIFLLPALIMHFAFSIYPFMDSFVLSFQSWSGIGLRKFVGIQNYMKIFHDNTFILAIKNSLYLGFVSSFFSVILGVILAWFMTYVKKIEGNIYRTILFSPGMLPAVVTALVFTFVYSPEMGMLNNLLKIVGFGNLQMAWLTNKGTVLNAITFVSVWKQFGLTMVLCFAGLQGINESLIESARLDGATEFQIFRKIILPLIMPFIELSSMFALTNGLKIYDSVVYLTNGGPGRFSTVMPMWIIENAFTYNEYGYASAMAIVFVVIVLIGILLIKKMFGGESYEQ